MQREAKRAASDKDRRGKREDELEGDTRRAREGSSGSVMTVGQEISLASASVRRLLGTARRTANLDRLMNSLKKCAG